MELVQALVSGLGMAGPVALGAVAGHLPLGLAASVGGLAVGALAPGWSREEPDPRPAGRHSQQLAAASLAAILISGLGRAPDAAMALLAVAAATIGGYSRPMAAATTRFIVFLAIAVNLADTTSHPIGPLALVVAGALWTACLGVVLGVLARVFWPVGVTVGPAQPSAVSPAQKFARWKRTLAGLSGWQFALRLAACLAVAAALRAHCPSHHFYWIALTVALLTQRQIEAFPVKTTQRALGTALGVIAASLFVAYSPPSWLLALGIGLLAGVRPLLRARNYLLYSAFMTPLIVLILSAGRPLESGVLIDRLVATLIAAALVVAANLVAKAALARVGSPPPGKRR